MQILTRRNLRLGNLLLLLLFTVAITSAIRPLLRAEVEIEALETAPVDRGSELTLLAEKEHHRSMEREYLEVIRNNSIFLAKVPKPPPKPKPRPKPKPLKEPPWKLVGMWVPEPLEHPDVYEATIFDTSKRAGKQELVVRTGRRFLEYDGVVVITEVTADYVRYEIQDAKNSRVVERFLPPEAARTATALQKDWSGIITKLRTNKYVVDMVRLETEFKMLAGEEGDWIETLIGTVKAEPYMLDEETGKLQGYKVLEFGPKSPLDELGVELQDVIVGLVQRAVTDEADGRALLKEVLESDEFRMHVSRLGKPIYIGVELKRY